MRECLSLLNDVCCQINSSATSRSLIQRNPTDCGVSECDQGILLRGLGPLGLLSHEKKYGPLYVLNITNCETPHQVFFHSFYGDVLRAVSMGPVIVFVTRKRDNCRPITNVTPDGVN